MYVDRVTKVKNPYTKKAVLDTISITIGLVVIVLGIFAFISPDERSYIFPSIFIAAAVFQGLLGIPRLVEGSHGRRDRKKIASGIGLCALALVLLMLAAISAICLWR